MTEFTNLLLIGIIAVLITDIAQFQESLKRMYWKWLWRNEKVKPEYKGFKIKPFDCSLCLTWWTGLFYLLYVRELSLVNIALTLFIACMTPVIAYFCRYIIDLLSKMVQDLYKISKIE